MEAEWRDNRRQRWLFNVAVFSLLIPFTVLISFIIGSLIGVGFGVALAAWRVAATPEITNRVSLRVRGRSRQFLRDLVIGLVGGFTLLGVSDFVSLSTVRNAQVGYPLSYTQPDSSCFSPGWPLGCPILYDPAYMILDYLFWAVVAFALVSIFRLAWIRLVHPPRIRSAIFSQPSDARTTSSAANDFSHHHHPIACAEGTEWTEP